MTTDTVLLDTCVLVPIRLTSVLMYAATRGVFTPRWSPRILASVERVVTDIHEDVTPQQIAHRVKQMTLEFPGAMVTGHEYLIPAMDNHEGDRHVLAAAVHVGVDILVTDNVKHFPDDVMQRHNIVVQTADEFLLGLYEAYPDRMADSVIAAVTARRRPPESVTDFLDDLAKCGVPGKTRDELAGRGLSGQIAHKGEKAPIQASGRWQVERTNSWHNAFNRLQRCYERRERVIDAFFNLADAIITLRNMIRKAWTLYRWDSRPARRP